MKLYLVQHGEALSKENDPNRPLSAKGRTDIGNLGDFLYQQGIAVPRIRHSGKTRALQTAELIKSRLPAPVRVDTVQGLNPNDSAAKFSADLEQDSDDLLVVSHLPLLANLVSYLLIGVENPALVGFSPGTLISLLRDDERWTLTFMLKPENLPVRTGATK